MSYIVSGTGRGKNSLASFLHAVAKRDLLLHDGENARDTRLVYAQACMYACTYVCMQASGHWQLASMYTVVPLGKTNHEREEDFQPFVLALLLWHRHVRLPGVLSSLYFPTFYLMTHLFTSPLRALCVKIGALRFDENKSFVLLTVGKISFLPLPRHICTVPNPLLHEALRLHVTFYCTSPP
ncbi:hypothetical protein KC315_g26 [Hortaea werneckii]|nr:hypothetical protein KC315_g26 [Hortaea werneckii]